MHTLIIYQKFSLKYCRLNWVWLSPYSPHRQVNNHSFHLRRAFPLTQTAGCADIFGEQAEEEDGPPVIMGLCWCNRFLVRYLSKIDVQIWAELLEILKSFLQKKAILIFVKFLPLHSYCYRHEFDLRTFREILQVMN